MHMIKAKCAYQLRNSGLSGCGEQISGRGAADVQARAAEYTVLGPADVLAQPRASIPAAIAAPPVPITIRSHASLLISGR